MGNGIFSFFPEFLPQCDELAAFREGRAKLKLDKSSSLPSALWNKFHTIGIKHNIPHSNLETAKGNHLRKLFMTSSQGHENLLQMVKISKIESAQMEAQKKGTFNRENWSMDAMKDQL